MIFHCQSLGFCFCISSSVSSLASPYFQSLPFVNVPSLCSLSCLSVPLLWDTNVLFSSFLRPYFFSFQLLCFIFCYPYFSSLERKLIQFIPLCPASPAFGTYLLPSTQLQPLHTVTEFDSFKILKVKKIITTDQI